MGDAKKASCRSLILPSPTGPESRSGELSGLPFCLRHHRSKKVSDSVLRVNWIFLAWLCDCPFCFFVIILIFLFARWLPSSFRPSCLGFSVSAPIWPSDSPPRCGPSGPLDSQNRRRTKCDGLQRRLTQSLGTLGAGRPWSSSTWAGRQRPTKWATSSAGYSWVDQCSPMRFTNFTPLTCT